MLRFAENCFIIKIWKYKNTERFRVFVKNREAKEVFRIRENNDKNQYDKFHNQLKISVTLLC